MSFPWFRMYAEFSGDPIIQSLAFEDQRHFVVLLCLKCNGTLDREMARPTRDRIICRGLGLDPVTAAEAQRRLVEVGLIDKNWQPSGWNARQFVSDSSTERVRKYRKKKEAGNVTPAFQERDCNAPDTDTDTETEKTPYNPPAGGDEKPNRPKRTRFVPPTVSDVAEYCRERKNSVDPAKFVDHYTTSGWKRGNTAIKDWKACVRTWEGNQNGQSANPTGVAF